MIENNFQIHIQISFADTFSWMYTQNEPAQTWRKITLPSRSDSKLQNMRVLRPRLIHNKKAVKHSIRANIFIIINTYRTIITFQLQYYAL